MVQTVIMPKDPVYVPILVALIGMAATVIAAVLVQRKKKGKK